LRERDPEKSIVPSEFSSEKAGNFHDRKLRSDRSFVAVG
jgi:hypothetical protein